MGFGVWFSGRSNKPETFMVAGRSLPGWLLGFSVFATQVSNITLIGMTGKTFSENWSPLLLDIGVVVGILIACKFFVPFHRKNKHVSAYTHLENRFGAWATAYGASFYVLIQMVRMGTIIYLISLALAPLLDVNQTTIMLVTGIVVIAYTYTGGIEAVIWTDFLQGVVLIVGVVVSLGFIVYSMPGGATEVAEIAIQNNKLSLGDWSLSLRDPTVLVVALLGITVFLQDFGISQNYVQRYVAARSDSEAKRGLYTNLIIWFPFMFAIVALGTSIFAFYDAHPQLAAAEGIPSLKPDSIYPHFIAYHIPVGLKGLMIASILASSMSSMDSSLNGIATVFYSNIYVRYINKHPGERKAMKVLHATSVVVGVLAICIAISMTRVKSIWDTWFVISTMLAGAIFGLFLLGVISKKATGTGALIGSIVGIISMLWMKFSPALDLPVKYPYDSSTIGLVGTLVILSVGMVVSRLTTRPVSSN